MLIYWNWNSWQSVTSTYRVGTLNIYILFEYSFPQRSSYLKIFCLVYNLNKGLPSSQNLGYIKVTSKIYVNKMCQKIDNLIFRGWSACMHVFLANRAFWFHYYCADHDECKYSDTFCLADRVRLFVQYTISLSSLCKLIWGHWTYEMTVRYILSSVWVRLSIFSQLSIIQYMGLCVFSWLISLVMIERIYTLSYYHHQIGSMNYCPLFRVRSWYNGMRCRSLYILMVATYKIIHLIVDSCAQS